MMECYYLGKTWASRARRRRRVKEVGCVGVERQSGSMTDVREVVRKEEMEISETEVTSLIH